jgi:hypothetical protein
MSEQDNKNDIQEHKYKTTVYTINNTLQEDVSIKQEEDDKCIEYDRTNLK